jgi:hypothetical protein
MVAPDMIRKSQDLILTASFVFDNQFLMFDVDDIDVDGEAASLY